MIANTNAMKYKNTNASNVPLQVLTIEVNHSYAALLDTILCSGNPPQFKLTHTSDLQEGIQCISQRQFHVVLLDLSLPNSSSMDTFKQLHQKSPTTPVVILSGSDNLELAQQAITLGAQDHLIKNDLQPELLKRVLRYASTRFLHHQEMARANTELRTLNRTLQSILNSIGEGVVVSDVKGQSFLLNEASERLGMMDIANPEKRIKELGLYEPDECTHFPSERLPMVRALQGFPVDNEEMFVRNSITPDGLHISVNARPMWGEQGEITGSVISFRDISERRNFEKKRIYDATHDALTKLPNRTLFMNRLEQRISQHQQSPEQHFALLFLDLDRFKNINDSWGHSLGDKVLLEVTQRLKNHLCTEDTIARFGGDEFVLLLHQLQNPLDAVTTAERIQELFTEPLDIEGQYFRTSASIGIVISTTHYNTAIDLLRNADIAMYAAKAKGKACHAVFGEEMHQKVIQFVRLEHSLRRALSNQEFSLYYQPIIDISTDKISGFEALIRWFPPNGPMISPGEFIPVAESTGLIVPIGWWVLNESCRQLKLWQQRFPDDSLTLSVNISARQFSSPDLVKQLDKALAKYNLEPRLLKLEITETAIMDNIDTATEILKQLKERHIELYMDDFGTGYSSLSYLHKFSVDVLKIDRSFVHEMQMGSQHVAIVQTIATLAQNLGMKIVAEGVETEEQRSLLDDMNITLAQGYFFAKPMPAQQVTKLLDEAKISPLTHSTKELIKLILS